jgi:hypothetical protein
MLILLIVDSTFRQLSFLIVYLTFRQVLGLAELHKRELASQLPEGET